MYLFNSKQTSMFKCLLIPVSSPGALPRRVQKSSRVHSTIRKITTACMTKHIGLEFSLMRLYKGVGIAK